MFGAIPVLCLCTGEAPLQTVEMTLIRECSSQPRVKGVLSSHTPTLPSRCSCSHTNTTHIFVQGGVGRGTQALCCSASRRLWSIRTRKTSCTEAPTRLLFCLEKCDKNSNHEKKEGKKPSLTDISTGEKLNKFKCPGRVVGWIKEA